MNAYIQLKNKKQKEFNAFPMAFAFSSEQLKEGLDKLGITKDEAVGIGVGGFIRKSDLEAFKAMVKKWNDAEAEAIANDKTGEGFIKDMFIYELDNHEFSYTGNSEDTVRDLGLTYEKIKSDKALSRGFDLARKEIMAREDY